MPDDPKQGPMTPIERRYRLALASNERLRQQIADLQAERRQHQTKLKTARHATHDQKRRADLWRHRAMRDAS